MLLCIISLRTRRLWHAPVAEPKSWVIASLGSLWGKTLLPLLSADDRRRVEANFSMWKRKPGAVTAEHRSLPRRGNWKPIVSGLQKVLTAVISLFEFNPTIVQRGWFLVALLCLRWHVESLAAVLLLGLKFIAFQSRQAQSPWRPHIRAGALLEIYPDLEKTNRQERICVHFCKLDIMDGIGPPLTSRFDSQLL